MARDISPGLRLEVGLIVELKFELEVELEFGWTGRWPTALMNEIGRYKVEIYQALQPNPIQSDMLTADRTFAVEGRRFEAVFVADRDQVASSEVRQLTVVWIEELR